MGLHYKREDAAYRLHLAEAERIGATVHNCGWGVSATDDWISIASKTDKGILQTNVQFGGRRPEAEHELRPYETLEQRKERWAALAAAIEASVED